MTSSLAVITIEMAPSFDLGPIELAWHGVMIAVGVLAGAWLAERYARRWRLSGDELYLCVAVIVGAGIVGSRLYYLVQTDASSLLRPSDWLGNQGFAFYGAMLGGTVATALVLWRRGLSVRYLDALAFGFPLGMSVGRLGDVINGEHYGPQSNSPLAFRYTHPDAAVPSNTLGYQSGAFYEVLLALVMLGLFALQRRRFQTPGALLAAVVAVYAAGRFLIFFVIRDTEVIALGLRQAQWTSLALLGAAGLGYLVARRKGSAAGAEIADQPAS